MKQRGGGGLEVKFMKDKDDNGFEKWDKYKTNDNEIDQLFEQHRRGPLPVNAPPVTLIKRRIQSSSLGGFKVVEETDIVLCFSEPGNSTIQESWRTICIEGKRKHCLSQQQKLLSEVRNLLGDHDDDMILVCSYAAFIAHAIARLWNDPSAGDFIKGSPPPPPPSEPHPRTSEGAAEDSMLGCGFDVLMGGPACK